MIRAVSFDVGGTLIEPYPSVGAVYAEVARGFGFECCAETITRQFGDAWVTRTQFGYTRNEWFDVVCHSFRGFAEVSPELFATVYNRFCEAETWRIFDDVLPALQNLKARGLKLAVISNWDDRLEPLLEKLRLHGFFEQITVSGRFGRHKPDREVFTHTVSRLQMEPGEVIHVGDSLREDIEGARGAGLRAVRIRRVGPERAEDISHLSELTDRLV